MEIEPDLTVCTVAGMKPQALRRLLRSIEETADPVSVEIVVAETEPGGAAGLADEFPGLLVIHAPGLPRLTAVNQAIRHGQGRYTALLDPDVLILPGCLKTLIDALDDAPDVGLASPRIVDAFGKEEPAFRVFPGPMALLVAASDLGLRPIPEDNTEFDWCGGGVHLLRRECLDEIGLLDARLPVLAEIDLYWRARRHGWHTLRVAGATAVHASPERYLSPLRPGTLERLRCLKKRWLP